MGQWLLKRRGSTDMQMPFNILMHQSKPKEAKVQFRFHSLSTPTPPPVFSLFFPCDVYYNSSMQQMKSP